MKYPMRSNWIIYKRTSQGILVVNVVRKKVVLLSWKQAEFLGALDGKTDPYSIGLTESIDEADEWLMFFEEQQLLRTEGRHWINAENQHMYTLYIPPCSEYLRDIVEIFSYIINIGGMFALDVILGMWIIPIGEPVRLTPHSMIAGTIVGFILGIVFHEIARAVVCIAYEGEVFEFGLKRKGMWIKSYTLMSCENLKKPWQKVWVGTAGVRGNLLLVALFWAFAYFFFPWLKGIYLAASATNVGLAIFYLLLWEDSDGRVILSYLLGDINLFAKFQQMWSSKVARKRFLKKKRSTCLPEMLFWCLLPMLLSIWAFFCQMDYLAWLSLSTVFLGAGCMVTAVMWERIWVFLLTAVGSVALNVKYAVDVGLYVYQILHQEVWVALVAGFLGYWLLFTIEELVMCGISGLIWRTQSIWEPEMEVIQAYALSSQSFHRSNTIS